MERERNNPRNRRRYCGPCDEYTNANPCKKCGADTDLVCPSCDREGAGDGRMRPAHAQTLAPLAIDLYAGLGGWTEGLIDEGYHVIGFDNERHVYGEARYPAQLVLQDVLTLRGAQFRHAALIVGSSPCQEFSYRAMPWKRAKALPPPYLGMELFNAQFRIQREANEAVRHHCQTCGVFMLSHHEWTNLGACSKFVPGSRYIPLVVENVCGAQKWVGRARWHFGSFYLWGDVPALMPITRHRGKGPKVGTGNQLCVIRLDQIREEGVKGASWYPPGHPKHRPGLAFNGHADRNLRATKNDGGSWFNVIADANEGRKGYMAGTGNLGKSIVSRQTSSRSSARKAASAHIAKIPYVLSRWVARAWYPRDMEIADAR